MFESRMTASQRTTTTFPLAHKIKITSQVPTTPKTYQITMNARQSSINMIIALVGMMMTVTAAYITPQPPLINVPVSIARHVEEQRQQPQNLTPSNSQQQQSPLQQNGPVSYSLGLGKNSVVRYSSTNRQNDSTDIIEAVQYWNEHEAVNEYPNPALIARARASILESSAQTLVTQKVHAAKTIKKVSTAVPPRIILQRFFQDQLPITTTEQHQRQQQQQHGDVVVDKSSTTIPTMKSRAPVVRQFDLNTPWVEMLIHEQQVKFA
jgi:hypothetical protein